jgi:hypothetical protein
MQDMGINKLANMFMGNPQPLAQKVQQAQQGVKPGQIPPDLEQAIALQKIQEMHAAAQNQQAMQAGGPQPTVVDKLRQMLQRQPQAQAQPEGTAPPPMQHPMAPQGTPPQGQPPQSQPQGLAAAQPQGAPQMPQVQAAHGGSIAQLMSNLGRHYDGGGIVAFAKGGDDGLSEEDRKKLEAQTAMYIAGAQEAAAQRPADAEPSAPAAGIGAATGKSEIQSLQDARERYIRSGSDTTGIDQAIAKLSSEMRPVMRNDRRMDQAKELANNPDALQQPTRYQSNPGRRGYNLPAGYPQPTINNVANALDGTQHLRGANQSSENFAKFAAKEGVPRHTGTSVTQDTESAYRPRRTPEGLAATPAGVAAAQKQVQQNAPRPAAGPVAPAAPQIPGTPYNPADATRRVDFPQVNPEDAIIQKAMGQDKEAARREEIERINQMIGKPDNAAVQETIDALKAKREKAQANASPLADWARGVASARPGQKWWQSGVAGSEYADKMAAQRESADTAFLEQILGHQQKVADTERAYKTQLYTAGSAAAERAAKEIYEAAIAAGKTKHEAAQLAQQERLKIMELASHEKTNAATNAAHIAGANIAHGPTPSDTLKADALKAYKASHPNADPLEAIAAVNAAVMGTKYTGNDKSFEHEKMVEQAIKDRVSMIDLSLQKPGLKPDEEKKLLDRRAEIEKQVRAQFPAPKGEARPGAALPMPATQADLVTGKIYDTARGPAKWNGSGFTPI